MGFRRGRVSYARFAVSGGPTAVTSDLIETLAEGEIRPPEIGPAPETQAGWVAGRHVYDGNFSPEVVAFGDLLVFGMRIDTNKVPAEIRQAYRAMAEDARRPEGAGDDAPIDGASRREAREEADDRCREELTAGRHRRSTLVPVLWDVRNRTVLAPAFADAKREALDDLFQTSFDATLDPRSAGGLAGMLASMTGRTRDYEDLSPTPFTAPPPGAHEEDKPDSSVPDVPWSNLGPEPKDFLGNEFVLWLWSLAAAGEGVVETERGPVAVVFERTLETECAWAVSGKQTLRADAPTRWPEARESLRIGKWPRKVGLTVAAMGEQWQLTFQADRFHVTSVKLPEPEEKPPTEREIVEGRLASVIALDETMVELFRVFLDLRLDGSWSARRQKLIQWIRGRRGHGQGGDKPAAVIEMIDRPVEVPAG